MIAKQWAGYITRSFIIDKRQTLRSLPNGRVSDQIYSSGDVTLSQNDFKGVPLAIPCNFVNKSLTEVCQLSVSHTTNTVQDIARSRSHSGHFPKRGITKDNERGYASIIGYLPANGTEMLKQTSIHPFPRCFRYT